MRHQKLIWQIFPANIIITFLAMLAVTWYSTTSLHDFYINELEIDLKARAVLIANMVSKAISRNQVESLRDFCVETGRASETRITVVDSAGKVIADSNENPDNMDNHANRPEIREARQNQTGTSIRYSHTLDQNMIYVAVTLPLVEAGEKQQGDSPATPPILRMSVPLTSIDKILQSIQLKIALGVIPVICVAAFITFFVSRLISMPLDKMRRTAERFSKGDFSRKMADSLNLKASSEVVALAGAMDNMAGQLNERIQTIVEQRNELEIVFSSMREALIAVDSQGRIVNFNRASAEMFGIDPGQCHGRLLPEIVRNIDLQRLVEKILESGLPSEEEICLQDDSSTRYLRVNGVPLLDSTGGKTGALLVMSDVTHLRRLENVRRDFVANVSHELKTPVTSIRGYVETLLDGALDNRDDALRFLAVVQRQSELLSSIIDDLLTLSRIEEKGEKEEIALLVQNIKPVLAEVIESCRFKADEKNIKLTLNCPDNMEIKMNRILLKQAVGNLVINAIKYSESGSEVIIRAEEVDDGAEQMVISVEDRGSGIPSEHLSRIFERFYRNDKARSRKLGGTGLGLSIVKHIVKAHGGVVNVQSEVNQGTVFFIRLPRSESAGGQDSSSV